MRRNLINILTKGVAGLGVYLALPAMAAASQLQYFDTVQDTDWTIAGIGGMRNAPSGSTADLVVSGITGNVHTAYLYWSGPTNTTDTSLGSQISFDGNLVTGTFLGFSSDNCWGYSNCQAFRADVTSYVSAADDTYTLGNFIDPYGNINGFSLMAFYDDGNSTNNRDVVLFDGNDSNIVNSYDPPGWDITLNNLNYTAGDDANIVLSVADGQGAYDDSLRVNGNVVAPTGAIFQGDSVQDAGFPSPADGLLWDVKTYDVSPYLIAGLNDLNLTSGVYSDCLAAISVAYDLAAGSAPPSPNPVPEPATMLLFGTGLTGLAAVRRRKKN